MSQVGEVSLQRLLRNVAFRDIFKSAHKDNSQAPAQRYSGHQWTLWLASIIELRQRITFCCHSHCIDKCGKGFRGFLKFSWGNLVSNFSHSRSFYQKWASVWVLEWFGSVPIIQSAWVCRCFASHDSGGMEDKIPRTVHSPLHFSPGNL